MLRRHPQRRHPYPRHGARNRDLRDLATLAFNFKDYGVERFAAMVGWDVTVIDGILEDQCLALYRRANVELTR